MIRHARRRGAVLVAAAVTSTLLLGACGSEGGPVVTAPTSTPSSTAPVTTPTPAPTASSPTAPPSTPAPTETVEPQTPPPPPPPPSTSDDPSPSTTPPSRDRTKVLLGCVMATMYIKTATARWNAATKTHSASSRKAAGKTMSDIATKLRQQGRKSGHATFNRLARTLAKDFDDMAEGARTGTSVDAGKANEHRRALGDFCQDFVKKKPGHAVTAG